jgi:hypothetical protein
MVREMLIYVRRNIMNRSFSLLAVAGVILLNTAATAQEVTQAVSSVGYASATIKSPAGSTKITSIEAPSVLTRLDDGTKIEMDSDNSVYMVYPDGARVAALDGVHTLANGQTIAVKDGKRIP